MLDANNLPQPDPNLFNKDREAKRLFVKWSKIGDWIQGTLHDKRQVKSTLAGQEGKMQTVYEVIAHSGLFHDENKVQNPDGTMTSEYKPVVLQKGQLVSIGGNQSIDNDMRVVRIGQVFGMRYTEMKPSKTKGFAAQKVRKVYPGDMDPDYAGSLVDTTKELGVPDMA